MGKVLAGITISVDGFITGPRDDPGCGLGVGGERAAVARCRHPASTRLPTRAALGARCPRSARWPRPGR